MYRFYMKRLCDNSKFFRTYFPIIGRYSYNNCAQRRNTGCISLLIRVSIRTFNMRSIYASSMIFVGFAKCCEISCVSCNTFAFKFHARNSIFAKNHQRGKIRYTLALNCNILTIKYENIKS